MAEYLDQPVPQYSIDRAVSEGEQLVLGDALWSVLEVPGHTPGHLAFWDGAHRVLAVGDGFSSYDVGWVNVMLDGPAPLDDAITSLARLRELEPRLVLPGHGPTITNPEPAVEKAIARLERQRQNLDLAVTYGARRILAFALMIHGGMTPVELDAYLVKQAWARDAAVLLNQSVEEFARDLVKPMVDSGALTLTGGVVRAAQPADPVDLTVFDLPFPQHWVERE